MKNITALKVLVIIIISFSLCYNAHCQETGKRNYGFLLGTQFGFVHGKALEYVYNPPEHERKIFSELIWEMKPVFYYGFLLDFGLIDPMSRPGIFASISFKVGVPADTGVMEDRDWLQEYGYKPINENVDFTHFSSSTNKTREFLWLDAAVGASIPVRPFFYLRTFISGSWTRFSFTARGGYWVYPLGSGYFDDDEEVCRYQQDWFLLAAGISMVTTVLSPFSFDISLKASPLTYCKAVDEHIKTGDTFMDYSSLGFFLEPAFGLSFTAERVEFSFQAAWRLTERTRGESLKSSNGLFYKNGEAGAGLLFTDTRLIVTLRI